MIRYLFIDRLLERCLRNSDVHFILAKSPIGLKRITFSKDLLYGIMRCSYASGSLDEYQLSLDMAIDVLLASDIIEGPKPLVDAIKRYQQTEECKALCDYNFPNLIKYPIWIAGIFGKQNIHKNVLQTYHKQKMMCSLC